MSTLLLMFLTSPKRLFMSSKCSSNFCLTCNPTFFRFRSFTLSNASIKVSMKVSFVDVLPCRCFPWAASSQKTRRTLSPWSRCPAHNWNKKSQHFSDCVHWTGDALALLLTMRLASCGGGRGSGRRPDVAALRAPLSPLCSRTRHTSRSWKCWGGKY